jgi:hypothetical protein
MPPCRGSETIEADGAKRGGAVDSYSNGRVASLLDSAGPGTSRPVDSGARSATVSAPVEVYEADDALVVRVGLMEGLLELRVPRAAVKVRHHHRHHIHGFNADATPC